MALISCPNCKKQISDMAMQCPHCNCDIKNKSEPIKLQTEIRNDSKTKSKKIKNEQVIKVSFVLLLVIAVGIAIFTFSNNNENDINNSDITTDESNQKEDEEHFSMNAKPIDGNEYESDGFVYVIYDDNSIEITQYVGNENEVFISTEINDYPVSRIGNSAFENCTKLEEINIWADVIYIGKSAFKGCTSLKEISIPSTVNEIYDNTFEGCSNLEEANIWGDVVCIGKSAFKNCESLKEISIPKSCLLVDKSAFEGCCDLKEVNFWGGKVIGESSFKNCTSLKEVSIPSEITEVKESAFEGCTSLKEVFVWGDNTTFGMNAFANCPKLKEKPEAVISENKSTENTNHTTIEKNDVTDFSKPKGLSLDESEWENWKSKNKCMLYSFMTATEEAGYDFSLTSNQEEHHKSGKFIFREGKINKTFNNVEFFYGVDKQDVLYVGLQTSNEDIYNSLEFKDACVRMILSYNINWDGEEEKAILNLTRERAKEIVTFCFDNKIEKCVVDEMRIRLIKDNDDNYYSFYIEY